MTTEAAPDAVVAALETIHERGEDIRARELETALGRLDNVDDHQRETLEALSESLVASVLAPPSDSLLAAAEDADTDHGVDRIETALALFDCDQDAVGTGERSDGTALDEQPPEDDSQVVLAQD